MQVHRLTINHRSILKFFDDLVDGKKEANAENDLLNLSRQLFSVLISGRRSSPKPQEMFRGVPEVKVLKCIVFVKGHCLNDEKLKAIFRIADWSNAEAIKFILGVCSYFSPYFKSYADISAPIYLLLKNKKAFE